MKPSNDTLGRCRRCRVIVPVRLEFLPYRCTDPLCPPLVLLGSPEDTIVEVPVTLLAAGAVMNEDGSFGRKRAHTPLVDRLARLAQLADKRRRPLLEQRAPADAEDVAGKLDRGVDAHLRPGTDNAVVVREVNVELTVGGDLGAEPGVGPLADLPKRL